MALFTGDDWRETRDPALLLLQVLCDPGPPHRRDHGGARAHRADRQDPRLHPDLRAAHRPRRALPWAIEAPAATGARRTAPRSTIAQQVFRQALAPLPEWRVESVGAYFAYLRHPFPGGPRRRSPRSSRRSAASCACRAAISGLGRRGICASPSPMWGRTCWRA